MYIPKYKYFKMAEREVKFFSKKKKKKDFTIFCQEHKNASKVLE